MNATVSDGGSSDQDEVVIDVPNTRPNADAEPESQTVVALTLVTLNGSGSSDPDRGPKRLTFRWGFAQVPLGSTLTDAGITKATSEQASFTRTWPGSTASGSPCRTAT